MAKKLLIDFQKLRELKETPVEGIYKQEGFNIAFRTIRELATFMFTCRKCENAPCITACPANALEKDNDGLVKRAVYKCIRCKSCIVICPFGTMMDNLFAAKTSGRTFLDLTSEDKMKEFSEHYPNGVVTLVDRDENPSEHIYKLNENILIKEYTWT